MKKIILQNPGYLLTPICLVILLTSACSQNREWVRVEHPGKYDLIRMGHKEINGEKFRVTRVNHKTFLSYPDVHGPSFFSAYLLENTKIMQGETVLDMGAGSGIQAIFAAYHAKQVLATDISERALENTLINARQHGLEDRITVRKSDLFNSIKLGETFDVIITNIPIPWNDKKEEDWDLKERYFHQVARHLNPGGRIYFLDVLLDNLPRTQKVIEENKLKIMNISMVHVDNDKNNYELLVYRIEHAPPPPEKPRS